jgi:hypothetical protein
LSEPFISKIAARLLMFFEFEAPTSASHNTDSVGLGGVINFRRKFDNYLETTKTVASEPTGRNLLRVVIEAGHGGNAKI